MREREREGGEILRRGEKFERERAGERERR